MMQPNPSAIALHKKACLIRSAVLAAAAIILSGILTQAAQASDVMLANQPSSEYAARRQKLMSQVKDGVTVLIGAREEDLGEVGRFRQKNDFMYLTGVETPGAYLILVPAGLIPDKPGREILFIPARNLIQEKWTGPQMGPGAEAEKYFGIREVMASDKFFSTLLDIVGSAPARAEGRNQIAKIYTVAPGGSDAIMTREGRFVETLRGVSSAYRILDVSRTIGEMRKIKSAGEQALLQKAIDISGEGQRDCRNTVKPGLFEYEVQAVIEAAFTRNGSERPGYPSIVGSGINSTVLHYNENKKRIDEGDLVVVDVGAEYSYYTADITRTYPASGRFTERQRQVYQLVLDAQRAAEKAFKLGESTTASLKQVASEVIRSSPLRDSHGNTLDRYFIHGLSHWLGMDVHDVGDYSKPLPVGSVITIEPGIYIPDEKLGVRIEDNYLITESGLVKLSAKIPSDPDEIERLMTASHSSASAGSMKK